MRCKRNAHGDSELCITPVSNKNLNFSLSILKLSEVRGRDWNETGLLLPFHGNFETELGLKGEVRIWYLFSKEIAYGSTSEILFTR